MNGDLDDRRSRRLTHASFFSGAGGLDLGLERAGWRPVSFSEIDPYAVAVLRARWPDVPQLGDIVALADAESRTADSGGRRTGGHGSASDQWRTAELWSGGFPCQDLSVANIRRTGLAGSRSGLALAFLALAERHRPRFVLLENVPGLLTSNRGRDMATIMGALVDLGYGVGYRTLDAQHFGVPQRRRRVFILGVSPGGRAGAERAAEVLSVGSRCRRHPPTGGESVEGADVRAGLGTEIAGTVPAGLGHHRHAGYSNQAVNAGHVIPVGVEWGADVANALSTSQERLEHPGDATYVVGPPTDAARMRAADGLAGRLDDRADVVASLDTKDGGVDDNEAQGGHLVYVKSTRPHGADDDDARWEPSETSPTLNAFEFSANRTPTLAVGAGDVSGIDYPLLPKGLDSNRYRCAGNGVVSSVAEWIGLRLAEVE